MLSEKFRKKLQWYFKKRKVLKQVNDSPKNKELLQKRIQICPIFDIRANIFVCKNCVYAVEIDMQNETVNCSYKTSEQQENILDTPEIVEQPVLKDNNDN